MENDKPKRRPRYKGTHPRRFDEKYKEHDPGRFPEVVERVIQSGRTPAGMHLPICVTEIVEALELAPGQVVVDATLGYGGHSKEILSRILPGGRLVAMDVDRRELPRATERLRSHGFPEEAMSLHQANFSQVAEVVAAAGFAAVDRVLADLGCSSMQLDDPARGFSFKKAGPLDMRLDPGSGEPATALIARMRENELAGILEEFSDEPHAALLARTVLARRERLKTTLDLSQVVRDVLNTVRPKQGREEIEKSVRRVFQALRIAVNGELEALDHFLAALPGVVKPGGRVAILTFHSGEDRRVKKAFKGPAWADAAKDVIRASPEETRLNPRAASAKLRWALRS
jgi:16S rRNA (cytosine1402-N4)-methyltransferase